MKNALLLKTIKPSYCTRNFVILQLQVAKFINNYRSKKFYEKYRTCDNDLKRYKGVIHGITKFLFELCCTIVFSVSLMLISMGLRNIWWKVSTMDSIIAEAFSIIVGYIWEKNVTWTLDLAILHANDTPWCGVKRGYIKNICF